MQGGNTSTCRQSRCVRSDISAHWVTMHEGTSAGDTAHWQCTGVRVLETLRIGNARSEVWARERSIALGLNRQAALGPARRGTALRHVD